MELAVAILGLIISVVLVEGLTELFVKSEIFKPVREKLATKRFKYFETGTLVNCGYCFSVWAAIPVSIVYNYFIFGFSSWIIFIPGMTIVFHRLSNVWHNIGDKFLDKFYSGSRS